jgi:hypothetical protein
VSPEQPGIGRSCARYSRWLPRTQPLWRLEAASVSVAKTAWHQALMRPIQPMVAKNATTLAAGGRLG